MSRDIAEAEVEVQMAAAFGREPAKWATEALREQRLRENQDMDLQEADGVILAAAFGREHDPARLAEANRVLDAHSSGGESGGPGRPGLAERLGVPTVDSIIAEVAELAQSRLGLSDQRAQLYAQSEALRCREYGGETQDAIRALMHHRDALKAQKPHGQRTSAGGDKPVHETSRGGRIITS